MFYTVPQPGEWRRFPWDNYESRWFFVKRGDDYGGRATVVLSRENRPFEFDRAEVSLPHWHSAGRVAPDAASARLGRSSSMLVHRGFYWFTFEEPTGVDNPMLVRVVKNAANQFAYVPCKLSRFFGGDIEVGVGCKELPANLRVRRVRWTDHEWYYVCGVKDARARLRPIHPAADKLEADVFVQGTIAGTAVFDAVTGDFVRWTSYLGNDKIPSVHLLPFADPDASEVDGSGPRAGAVYADRRIVLAAIGGELFATGKPAVLEPSDLSRVVALPHPRAGETKPEPRKSMSVNADPGSRLPHPWEPGRLVFVKDGDVWFSGVVVASSAAKVAVQVICRKGLYQRHMLVSSVPVGDVFDYAFAKDLSYATTCGLAAKLVAATGDVGLFHLSRSGEGKKPDEFVGELAVNLRTGYAATPSDPDIVTAKFYGVRVLPIEHRLFADAVGAVLRLSDEVFEKLAKVSTGEMCLALDRLQQVLGGDTPALKSKDDRDVLKPVSLSWPGLELSGELAVGAIVRRRSKNGYRVWQVTGVFLGGENQEDVVELVSLDKELNTQGPMLVPREIFGE